MSVTPQTSSQEFTNLITEASAGVAPACPPPIPATTLLARHRRTLQAMRAKGYSLEQLATFLAHPSIGITISPVGLGRLLKAAAKPQPKPKAA